MQGKRGWCTVTHRPESIVPPYFRGVIWPHGQHETAPGVYRYAVVGMLVTTEPIPEFEGRDEVVLSGNAWMLADALTGVPEGVRVYKTGAASSVLVSLGTCIRGKDEDE